MMKKELLILFLAISFQLFSQDIETEIKNIHTKRELINYWKTIFNTDQKYRGLNSVDSIDNLNFKKLFF